MSGEQPATRGKQRAMRDKPAVALCVGLGHSHAIRCARSAMD